MPTILKLGVAASTVLLLCTACNSSDPTPAPTPPPTNAAPVFSSAASVNVGEGTSGVFYTASATDANGDSLSFSVSGGTDSSRFLIDGGTGGLRFISTPDFESPADADADNVYQITLTVSDGTTSTTLNLTITVTDNTNMGVQLTRVATGLNRPVYVTGPGDGSGRLFIVEQRGQIKILDQASGNVLPMPFLDLGGTLAGGNEQGLLGLAFAPDFATSGLFYVNITNAAGDTEILEFGLDNVDPNLADASSRRVILTIDQPASNHNAGWIEFGPDGNLYIPTGDGGGSGDPHGNGQNINSLLGAILRIDPSGDDFPANMLANYSVPAGNPFVGAAGADAIWAYGFRNPFRASFDRDNGDLYIGDVGQGAVEEIDLLPAGTSGLNFGWNILEGTQVFNGPNPGGLTPPIAEYTHGNGPIQGFSVTGGYVHRGSVEALAGEYIFADFVTENVWSIPVAGIVQGTTIAAADFTNRTTELTTPDAGSVNGISSFGEDEVGEMYIVALNSGEVFRIENQP